MTHQLGERLARSRCYYCGAGPDEFRYLKCYGIYCLRCNRHLRADRAYQHGIDVERDEKVLRSEKQS